MHENFNITNFMFHRWGVFVLTTCEFYWDRNILWKQQDIKIKIVWSDPKDLQFKSWHSAHKIAMMLLIAGIKQYWLWLQTFYISVRNCIYLNNIMVMEQVNAGLVLKIAQICHCSDGHISVIYSQTGYIYLWVFRTTKAYWFWILKVNCHYEYPSLSK